MTDNLTAADPRAGQVPPYTVEESREVLAAGLSLYPTVSGGQRSHEVREGVAGHDRGRHLGRVTVVTETLGNGVWHRYAAYRPDGSRVGYGESRLAAAELLRADAAPEPGPVSLSETLMPGEYVVRRDGELLGIVRPQPGLSGAWEAWDTGTVQQVRNAATPEDAAEALVNRVQRRADEAARGAATV